MEKHFFAITGTSRNSAGDVRWAATPFNSERDIIDYASEECNREGTDLYALAGIDNVGVNPDKDGNFETFQPSREFNPGEEFEVAINKLNDDGRTFLVFDDSNHEDVKHFLEKANEVGLGDPAQKLVDDFYKPEPNTIEVGLSQPTSEHEKVPSVTTSNAEITTTQAVKEMLRLDQLEAEAASYSSSIDSQRSDNRETNSSPIQDTPVIAKTHILKTNELPDELKKMFMTSDMNPGKFMYHDTGKLAFTDTGAKLATQEVRPEVIQSMVRLAQEKNWQAITLKGTEEFKREAWLQASLEGIKVKGYEPKAEDLARLDTLSTDRAKNSMSHTVDARIPLQTASASPTHEADTQAKPNIVVPDDYKPSPQAIAAMEHLYAKGVPPEKVRVAMYGADITMQAARDAGVPVFQAQIFDKPTASTKSISVQHNAQVQQPKIKR